MSQQDANGPAPKFVAVIPVKNLRDAKSRLKSAISAETRRAIVFRLLDHTLEVVQGVAAIDATYVVSSDFEVLKYSEARGAIAVPEISRGHNRALRQARTVAAQRHADAAVLLLAADLPALTSRELDEICAIASSPSSVVVAPDHRSRGTNALAGFAARELPLAFGQSSFERHVRAAELAGHRVHVYRSTGTMCDLDVPADLARLPRDWIETQAGHLSDLAAQAYSPLIDTVAAARQIPRRLGVGVASPV